MNKNKLIKRKKTIRNAGTLAIASWPAGLCLGLLMSIGQDSAGAGMYIGIGLSIAVMFISGPACIILIWCSLGIWRELNNKHKAFVLVPLALFTLLLFGPIVAMSIYELLH